MKMTSKRMMESQLASARQRVRNHLRDFKSHVAEMQESLERGDSVDPTVMQHATMFTEACGTYNAFKLVLEMLEAEAELKTI